MNATTQSAEHLYQCQTCIDAVLCSLASRFGDVADPVLDLKLDTGRKMNPGTCIQTYFSLVKRLPPAANGEMHQIRFWLERLIEVLAFKTDNELFSRRPIDLDGDSLERCCTAIMEDYRRITAHAPCDLELRFAFR